MPEVTFAYGKLPSRDVAVARQFYADAFGIEPYAERGDHLYYDVSGCRFMIFASSGRASGTHDQLGFVVADIRSAVDELGTRGIDVMRAPGTAEPVMDFGPVQAAWLTDPDGNLINVIAGSSPLWS